VHDAFPDKETWFTECSGGEWDASWESSLLWQVRHLIIGTTRHWARGVVFWNLALDEAHGPHRGGCRDCRGVVTIDSRTGAVTKNLEYYALAHASAFVRPGAARVASDGSGVDHVAFHHVDDGSVVLVLANSLASEQSLTVVVGGNRVAYRLPPTSVATLVMTPAVSSAGS
jgi:glucosylceramidase